MTCFSPLLSNRKGSFPGRQRFSPIIIDVKWHKNNELSGTQRQYQQHGTCEKPISEHSSAITKCISSKGYLSKYKVIKAIRNIFFNSKLEFEEWSYWVANVNTPVFWTHTYCIILYNSHSVKFSQDFRTIFCKRLYLYF